jgi:hypothetical protein
VTVLDDVFGSLAAMSLLQLLLAFVACTGYTLAQGRLIAPRARRIASATTAMAALAFVLLGGAWARSTMLIAFAIAGLGAFIAIVWLSGRLLGLAPAQAQAVQAADSGPGEDPIILESDATTAPGLTRPRPRRTPMSSA